MAVRMDCTQLLRGDMTFKINASIDFYGVGMLQQHVSDFLPQLKVIDWFYY